MKAANVENSVSPETFQGWSKLEPNEQTKISVEIQALEKAAESYEMSSLEIGEHLDNINQILSPKRQFNRWLSWWLSTRKNAKSRSWAYQSMAEYKAVKSKIPKAVLEIAKQRGTKITPQVMIHNPPPKTEDKTQIQKYLDNLRTSRIEVIPGPDTLLKECVNFVGLRWEKLPNNNKARTAFMRALVGMLLARFGVASELSFAPMAIPDNFRAKRGRPVTLSKAA